MLGPGLCEQRKDAHADHEPIAEGLLQKRAVKSGRNFKWRLFRLYASARLVYLAPSGKVEKGILTLNHEFFCSDWTGKKCVARPSRTNSFFL